MHGLVNRAIECFVRDTYGPTVWADIARSADLPFAGFEAMLDYDDRLTDAVLASAEHHLARPMDALLEDLGTYLVSHPNLEAVRRLLRFGGEGFTEFLHSLDDLPERARLAVADLHLPELELIEHTPSNYTLVCRSAHPGFAPVLQGLLRAMADDYGVLALLDRGSAATGTEMRISIALVAPDHAEGRDFALAERGRARA